MSSIRRTRSADQFNKRERDWADRLFKRADPTSIKHTAKRHLLTDNPASIPTLDQNSGLDSDISSYDNKPLEDHAIKSFLRSYESSEYLAYVKLTKLVMKIVKEKLKLNEIACEVYNRGKQSFAEGWAKDPVSVKRTVFRRQKRRGQRYQTTEEIKVNMHDLAGLRIALYFPNDFQRVEEVIQSHFIEAKPPQDWPDQRFGPDRYQSLDIETGDISGRNSRFPGYFARHYRVQLSKEDVVDAKEPAIKGRTVEIQLMSLLMHAWSKMHHELVYKPRPGIPLADEDDERLIDISNGVIIAGEQILRQIQINIDRKQNRGHLRFRDEDDLWSHIRGLTADRENRLREKQKILIQSLSRSCK